MSLFAKNLSLGFPMRSDVHIVNMPFEGARPKAGDVVKLTAQGRVQVTTNSSDRAYGVVTFYDNEEICAVVTHGHVLANLGQETQVGSCVFGILDVVRALKALDQQGIACDQAYEVRVN